MISLILGDTNFEIKILEKIKKKNIKYFIIDLSKNNIFKKENNSNRISIGQFGKMINLMKQQKCNKVIFAGKIDKPKFSSLRMDIKGFYPYVNELVNKILKFREDHMVRAKEILSGLNTGQNSTMVSVHIRLTDFAKHLKILWNMQYASDEYFKRAMNYFHSKYKVRLSASLNIYQLSQYFF